MQPGSLSALFEQRSLSEDKGVVFIEGSQREEFVSYRRLYQSSLRALAYLQQQGLGPGDELVFQISDNKTFIIVFWACILGRIVAVPLTAGNKDDHRQKLFNVWGVLGNPYLICSAETMGRLNDYASLHGLGKVLAAMRSCLVGEEEVLSLEVDGVVREASDKDLAFIQFSSGSTGSPKGVILTHGSLLTNVAAIGAAAGYTADDMALSWMPLTHDMGLIGFHLSPLFSGMSQCLLPSTVFIRNPLIWLDKASQHKASILCSPNFGYQYLINHSEAGKAYAWDLSAVRIIYNGAEPVSGRLCREFAERMRPYGLRKEAMCPVYGLAEATLAVTISDPVADVISLQLRRDRLNPGDRVMKDVVDGRGVEFVNVGRPVDNCSVKITDQKKRAVKNGTIGHIRIKGASVTKGYYHNPEATGRVIDEYGWLDTGDLGFILEGSLYVTGRAKDIVFVNGQNYYPHDIEGLAEGAGIGLNKIAVAGCFNAETGKDELIAFVLHRGDRMSFKPVAQALSACVGERIGLEIDRVVPVRDIPRTTSGKLQRFRLLELFREGAFSDCDFKAEELRDWDFKNWEFKAVDMQEGEGSKAGLTAMGAGLTTMATGLTAMEARLAEFKLAEMKMAGLRQAEKRPASGEEARILALWRRVLRTTDIGMEQSFFALGGNSLKAAELAMLMEKEFQVELPLDTMYAQPTIRGLARSLQALVAKQFVPIPAAGDREDHPLTPAQKRLYYHWELDRDSIAYNIPVALEGRFDVGRLEECIRQLIRRHDALRMSFFTGRTPGSVVSGDLPFALTVEECREEELDGLLRGSVRPFDLGQAPLFRASIIKTGEDRMILFMDFHHIISDGMSVYLFIEELERLYNGQEVAELKTGYIDYAHWAVRDLGDGGRPDAVSASGAYWLERLKGTLPVLELPLDQQRPVRFDPAGARMDRRIDVGMLKGLKELADARGCSLHVLLLTIYRVLLWKYTGQEEQVIGIPVAGRRHPDLREVQGMFVNNLAIRGSIRGDLPFGAVLEAERAGMAEALANQDHPFDLLVQRLGGQRDLSRNVLFDTMFNYQNMGFPGNSSGMFTRYVFDPGFSKYDLSMELWDDGWSLEYGIEYATALFREGTIRQMAGHFERLIGQVIENPDRRIADLAVLTAAEYAEQVVDYNQSGAAYPSGKTIHQLFEEQVERTPHAVALVYGSEELTYRQLQDKANRLAFSLRKRGVGPDVVVGILLDRSPSLVVAILGILKAGGCYLPMETGLPQERISFLVADSGCELVITDRVHARILQELSSFGGKAIKIDAPEPDLPGIVPANGWPGPENLAYIIYTSGTTGRPKGVMITHRSLVNYSCWAAEKYTDGGESGFPLYTSISFDLTVTSVFTPLITGNRIVIYDERGLRLPIEQVIADNLCEVIKLTPSHLSMVVEGALPLAGAPSRVKRLIVGGEQLESGLAAKAQQWFGAALEIYNEYGPTEATVGCMIHRFSPGEGQQHVPIGIPAANTQIYVLDAYLKPVPEGVHGELYIAGDCLAKGYLYNEELTGEKFVDSPFNPGAKMYKTGDIARRLPGGCLVYLGRIDQQVKLNGYRIELAEIEAVLLAHPVVARSIVTVRVGRAGQKQLVGYYERKRMVSDAMNELLDETMEAEALVAFLRGRLPYYMVPSAMVRVDELPLTRNGKVDMAALPEPGLYKAARREAMGPRNSVEEKIAAVWGELLNEEVVSIRDNFFEAGGDSIKAVQMASRLLEDGIMLTARDILTHHTIEQISPYARVNSAGAAYEQGVIRGERGLTDTETWFFGQDLAQPGYYHQSVLLVLRDRVSKDLLEQAFTVLIRHHDSLRINYSGDGQKIIYNETHLHTPFLIGEYWIGAGELENQCQEIRAGFDIGGGLLLKAALIREAGGRDLLFITAHHLVVDGVSWRILLEDLYAQYRGLEKGELAEPAPKTAAVTEWAREMRNYAALPAVQGEAGYWEAVERTDFVIPVDAETEDWRWVNARRVFGKMGREDTRYLLKRAHQAYRTDVPILLNTALAMALRDWTRSGEIVIEQEGHGRELEGVDVSRTVGWFTTIYPVRLVLPGGQPEEQIKAVKEQLRSVPAHGLGYGAYRRRKEGIRRSEVRFNYLGQFGRELENDLFGLDTAPTGNEAGPENAMSARLEFNVMVVGEELRLELCYNSKAHAASTAEALVQGFFDKLRMLLEHIRSVHDIHFTPSDFSTARLDQGELDALFQ